MSRTHYRLTARAVATISKRGQHSDGGGLVLQVSRWGTRSWLFVWARNGKRRHMGLGPVHTISLAEAREKARECRKAVLEGRDPIEERKGQRQQKQVDAAKTITFKECGEAYIAAHQAGWKSAVHLKQWVRSLQTHVYPVLGSLPVAAIDTALVMRCLEPLWTSIPETGNRLRGRIELILGWATVRNFRTGDNPARWRGHLDKLLPKPGKVKKVKHFAALPYSEIPAFMATLRVREGARARALEFMILTVCRTGELLGARHAEIKENIWTIPRDRMKGGKEHRVPLTSRAVAIVNECRDCPGDDAKIFPGLVQKSLLAMLGTMGCEVTAHGFRSAFRDWAAETTVYPNHVVEMVLAHAIGDKVEGAYRRGDLFEKRRELMEEWARYCGVVAIPAGGRPERFTPARMREIVKHFRQLYRENQWTEATEPRSLNAVAKLIVGRFPESYRDTTPEALAKQLSPRVKGFQYGYGKKL
jgi:integrase